jgi:hypothetical protein
MFAKLKGDLAKFAKHGGAEIQLCETRDTHANLEGLGCHSVNLWANLRSSLEARAALRTSQLEGPRCTVCKLEYPCEVR